MKINRKKMFKFTFIGEDMLEDNPPEKKKKKKKKSLKKRIIHGFEDFANYSMRAKKVKK